MITQKFDTFLSYQFTGIDPQVRAANISKIVAQLEAEGRTIFCSDALEPEFQKRGMTPDDIYAECFRIQSEQNFEEVVFFFMDPRESKGMRKELDRAKELGQRARVMFGEGMEHIGELEWAQPFMEYAKKFEVGADEDGPEKKKTESE